MTSLLERLTRAETTALHRVDELRAALVEAEERLRRLAITRETLMTLPDEDRLDGDTDHSDEQDVAEEPPAPAGLPDEDEAVEVEAAPELPVLRGLRERAVALLATSDRPLRPRELVQAMGKPDTRSQAEGMRSRLRRLVDDGWLQRQEDGLYTIATGVNGRAPKREAR